MEVKAELVGNVWKITSKPGDEVAEDDVLMILESMKMEIPVVSPIAGTVSDVAVAPDTQIKEGDLVAVIDE